MSEINETHPGLPANDLTLGSMRIEQEARLDAPPDRVFQALTQNIGEWWGAPYARSENSETMILEPKVGGRFYEKFSGEDGWLWATVLGIKTNEYLVLSGSFGTRLPLHAVLTLELEAYEEGKTILKLSYRAYGALNENTKLAYAKGWRDLLGKRLRAFVERGERYGLGHPQPPENSNFDGS